MALNLKTLTLLAGAVLLSSIASAQFGSHRYSNPYANYARAKQLGFEEIYQRDAIGYTMNFMPAVITYHYQEFNEPFQQGGEWHLHPNGDPVSKKGTINLNSVGSWGAIENVFFPINKMGEASCFAICIEANVGVYTFETDEVFYSDNASEQVEMFAFEMGIPVTLDYRTGGDVTLEKSRRFMFAMGAGVNPCFSGAAYGPVGNMRFKMRPYLKAEIGFFAGIALKVRASATLGTVDYGTTIFEDTYTESYTSSPNDVMEINLKTKSSFSIGLLLMPFSWDWESYN